MSHEPLFPVENKPTIPVRNPTFSESERDPYDVPDFKTSAAIWGLLLLLILASFSCFALGVYWAISFIMTS
jgi:hypothetical protein